MAIGTAGYTAMLCVMALEAQGLKPGDGEVLVTGAAGGVGSVAIALLSGLGHRVVASTGRSAEADYLKALGATDVIDRATLAAPGKPLQKERWAGVVDAVGSHTLANACAQTRYPRRGRGLRARPGHGPAGERRPVHPARRAADRRRLGDVPEATVASHGSASARSSTSPSSTR